MCGGGAVAGDGGVMGGSGPPSGQYPAPMMNPYAIPPGRVCGCEFYFYIFSPFFLRYSYFTKHHWVIS